MHDSTQRDIAAIKGRAAFATETYHTLARTSEARRLAQEASAADVETLLEIVARQDQQLTGVHAALQADKQHIGTAHSGVRLVLLVRDIRAALRDLDDDLESPDLAAPPATLPSVDATRLDAIAAHIERLTQEPSAPAPDDDAVSTQDVAYLLTLVAHLSEVIEDERSTFRTAHDAQVARLRLLSKNLAEAQALTAPTPHYASVTAEQRPTWTTPTGGDPPCMTISTRTTVTSSPTTSASSTTTTSNARKRSSRTSAASGTLPPCSSRTCSSPTRTPLKTS